MLDEEPLSVTQSKKGRRDYLRLDLIKERAGDLERTFANGEYIQILYSLHSQLDDH